MLDINFYRKFHELMDRLDPEKSYSMAEMGGGLKKFEVQIR